MADRIKANIFGLARLAILAIALGPLSCFAELNYTGVNLAGADFGEGNLPGTYNIHYTYPTSAEVDYFIGKGMNTFRLPFRWERLQQSLNASFNAAEFLRLDNFVNYATAQGAYVVLDPHNYARYHGSVIGGGSVSNASFADFWSRLANEYRDNPRVIFGLMNEPNSMPTEQWRDAANTAIAAIRNAGATNLILVPGNAWTGAHSWTQNWYGTPNSVAMLGIVDPGNNFAFDVHQYLDDNSAGDDAGIVSQTVGQQRLVQFTDWLHANDRRGFLGEFAVANSTIGAGESQIGDVAIDNMLNYIQANSDVWLGWTWWAAGPWWGNYMFTLEPTNLGQPGQTDRPAMGVLQPHLAVPAPTVPGDFNHDGKIDAADYVVWRKTDGDEVDYDIWRDNFGRTVSAGSESNRPVPEPATALLFVLVAALGCWRSSRNPSRVPKLV
jgi:endoglucanase